MLKDTESRIYVIFGQGKTAVSAKVQERIPARQ
jgi:hypothetical protein